jgi:hypothetical protein
MAGQLRHQLCLVLQAAAMLRIASNGWFEGLDRDAPVECDITRQVDHAHAAARHLPLDPVAADLGPGRQGRRLVGRECVAHHPRRARRAFGRGDKFRDVARQGCVCSTQLADQPFPPRGVRLQHPDEDIRQARGCGIGHAAHHPPSRRSRGAGEPRVALLAGSRRTSRQVERRPSSSRSSQALASVQRRLTVAGDESSWSAVSSTVNPPKNRSSTIRASSGLWASSRASA